MNQAILGSPCTDRLDQGFLGNSLEGGWNTRGELSDWKCCGAFFVNLLWWTTSHVMKRVERLFFVSAFRLLTCNGNLRDVSWGGCHGVPVTVVLGSSHSGKPAKINKYESLENSSGYSKIIVWFSIDSLKPLYLCVFLNFFRNYCFNINPITVSMILLPSCFWTWVDSTPMFWTWLEESREIATKMGLHLPPSLGLQSPSLHPLLFAIGIPEYPRNFWLVV